MLIYKATNLINKKFYIGYTTTTLEERQKDHFKRAKNKKINRHFQNAIRKYGKENFKWEIMNFSPLFEIYNEDFKNKTSFAIEILKKLEKHYIISLNAMKLGYNKTNGGDGTHGYSPTKEHRNKISKSTKGRKNTKEHNKKISQAKKGVPRSEEMKKKLQGKNNPMYGKHHTEEAKLKISHAFLGKNNPNYGKPMSEEQKEKISNTLTRKDIDDNIIMELLKQCKTQKQIAKELNCSSGTISNRLIKLNINISEFRRNLIFIKIKKLIDLRMSIQQIADELNYSYAIIRYQIKQMKKRGIL
jgi:group I intron endonuclease